MSNNNTCKTFLSPREALAFIMGFHAAASEDIMVHVDPQEPQTILADFNCQDDEAEGVWLKAALAFEKAAPKPQAVYCQKCGWDFQIITPVPDTEAYAGTTWFCPHCGSSCHLDKPVKKRRPSDIDRAHDALSAALENPEGGNDEVRDVAVVLCEALNKTKSPLAKTGTSMSAKGEKSPARESKP